MCVCVTYPRAGPRAVHLERRQKGTQPPRLYDPVYLSGRMGIYKTKSGLRKKKAQRGKVLLYCTVFYNPSSHGSIFQFRFPKDTLLSLSLSVLHSPISHFLSSFFQFPKVLLRKREYLSVKGYRLLNLWNQHDMRNPFVDTEGLCNVSQHTHWPTIKKKFSRKKGFFHIFLLSYWIRIVFDGIESSWTVKNGADRPVSLFYFVCVCCQKDIEWNDIVNDRV